LLYPFVLILVSRTRSKFHQRQVLDRLASVFSSQRNRLSSRGLARACRIVLRRDACAMKRNLLLQPHGDVLYGLTLIANFADNGQLEIDNNTAERALRGVALGRKKLSFLRIGCRRRTGRTHLLAARINQTQRPRSRALPAPRPRTNRRPSHQPHPRAPALERVARNYRPIYTKIRVHITFCENLIQNQLIQRPTQDAYRNAGWKSVYQSSVLSGITDSDRKLTSCFEREKT
jgi:hypothetical protein